MTTIRGCNATGIGVADGPHAHVWYNYVGGCILNDVILLSVSSGAARAKFISYEPGIT